VKKWSDAVKFVNMELLTSMINYDPTALQKKIRFKRLKRVMKCKFNTSNKYKYV
jgi:hypothetical protein